MLVAALLSLLQYPLLQATLHAFGGDFRNVNALFAATTVIAWAPTVRRLGRAARAAAGQASARAQQHAPTAGDRRQPEQVEIELSPTDAAAKPAARSTGRA